MIFKEIQKLKTYVIIFGLAILAACSQNSQPIESNPKPSSQLETTTSLESTTTQVPQESSTTITTEQPTEPAVVDESILCQRYSHPLHHLSCEDADAYKPLVRNMSASTPTIHSHTSTNTSGGTTETELNGCIRKYESGGTTDTNGSNNHRDGYYQIIPSTWDNYGGYSTAQQAPKNVQDEKFNQLWKEGGHQHWAAQKGRCF